MSQIICARCGESFDSTGGLHFTHSDLTARDYSMLVVGSGCICCRENLRGAEHCIEYSLDNTDRWRKSVEHLSEGNPEFMYATFEKMPVVVPFEQLPDLEIR